MIHIAKGKYKYWLSSEGLLKLEAYARDGLTNVQIAGNLDINPDTLYTWMKKYPEISESLKRGKEVVDIQVENALLKRALGYRYKEIKTEEYETDAGPVQKVTTTVKEVIPDTTAQIFWLKNRKPTEWREKQNIELSGVINNPFEGLTTQELKKIAGIE